MKKDSKRIVLQAHFIPNSHLDREWGMDYQQTRKLTVEFIDALLKIFKKVPEYKFLLDSQTVPLEDYLEIRPENREALIGYIREGRIQIGPWYSAPDPHCINGESIARNLLMGHRTARAYGPVMKVGYTPFGFGQTGQLPQIYQGFGIDTALFYRGIAAYDTPSAEFIWEGADGTRVLASRFGCAARYNFYMYIWRPVLYKGRMLQDRLFDWTEGGVPFKLVDGEHRYDNYFLAEPKRFYDPSSVEKYFRSLLEKERQHFTTPAIPLMQGMDTSMPDAQEAELIEEIRKTLGEGEEVRFSSLPEYIRALKSLLKMEDLQVIRGERRSPHEVSYWATLAGDVISNRPRQKLLSEKAERMLQRWAEPFCLWAWLAGEEYPERFLETAWKYLLKCHAHDTIGGCGVDALEHDSIHRLNQVVNLSTALMRSSMGALQTRIDTSFADKNEIVLTLFNPSPIERTEVVRAYVDVPASSGICHLSLFDNRGRKMEMFEGRRRDTEKVVRSPIDVANALKCDEVEIEFLAEAIPALGYKTFVVRGGDHHPFRAGLASSPREMENEHLRVFIETDGTLAITHKATGKTYEGLHVFEDGGEAGEPWTRHPAAGDRIVTSAGTARQISIDRNSPLSATLHVRYEMSLPLGLGHDTDYHDTWRSEEERPLTIDSYFTLRRGCPFIEVETRLENRHKNHRLRVLFPTRLKAEYSCAESAFDVVQRVIERGKDHPHRLSRNPQYPLLRYAGVSDGKAGLALLSDGIREYEAMDDRDRTLALTLIRGFEIALCTVSYRWERLPEMEGSQALGWHTFRYGIYPHAGDWDRGQAMEQAERFSLPVLTAQSAPIERGKMPSEASLFQVTPSTILFSGLKKAESGNAMILRLYNPTTRMIAANIEPGFAVGNCSVVTLEEKPMKETFGLKTTTKGFTLKFPPKKVITLKMTRKR